MNVAVKYIGTRPAIIGGRYIYQGEVRRVAASQYEAAERANPGQFEVLSDERKPEQSDQSAGSTDTDEGRDTDEQPAGAGNRGRRRRFVESPADDKTDNPDPDRGDEQLQSAG